MNWLILKAIPFSSYHKGKVASKNQHQFTYSVLKGSCLYIVIFDIHTNEWTYDKYSFDVEMSDMTKKNRHGIGIIMNDKENKIYLCTPQHAIIIINTITKQYQFYEWDKHCFGLCQSRRSVSVANVNGIVHLIVSTETKTKHIIFNEENGTFSEMFDFTQYQKHNEMVSPIIIYASTKKILLLSFVSKYNKHLHGLWIFKLETNKWNKIHSIVYPPSSQFSIPSAIITADQQFVIFSCSKRKIYVLDIRGNVIDYKLTHCMNTKSEPTELTSIVATGGGKHNEILIFGWVRNLFSNFSFNDVIFPPSYIIKFIMKWYSIELIHFIHDPFMPGPPYTHQYFYIHQAVNVKDILFYANIQTKKTKKLN